ncbi:hypothetical protein [Halopenitus persicus]|uniref:Uncharacterized protein n=1 Tax=Halopenitus persicus TaxID=1048396 RepID=A0A1H3JNB9_9EURY|nr:hypothetical protein [Halopenitus persicus]QHS15805.1 hypothetical protein GWK26_00835 [haloarchaeon 3A1-DGR]SDY41422.1 hypothetical protein SAMN05216564_10582 [Halopenitus persicus]
MNVVALLPIVAGIAAVVIGVTRRLSLLLIELDGATLAPRLLALTTLGGRFVSFLAVYGLVLGTAYLVGRRDEPRRDETRKDEIGTTLRTNHVLPAGGVAALAHLLTAGAILLVVELAQSWIVTVAVLVGSSVGVGVQIAIVAVAGLALGARR